MNESPLSAGQAPNVFTIVVSYNRKVLLERCLAAIRAQTLPTSRLIIVDNNSTDGTRDMLHANGWLQPVNTELLALADNTGGAGGFSAGMQHAFAQGAEWVWIMDDDAEPHADALRQLMAVASNPSDVYGSLAVNGDDTAWATTLVDQGGVVVNKLADVPARARVQSLPFLGFMIHRDLVQRIGLPDVGYFIAADDVEYCLRAEHHGAQIIIAGTSHIHHPKSDRYPAQVLGRSLLCLKLPPWKRYYDTRNRLLIARKYYGIRLFTQTIPGSFVRLIAALMHEPRRLAQLGAFAAGMVDGLFGIKGRRHERWGIKP